MANIGDAVRVRFDLSKIGGMDAFRFRGGVIAQEAGR